MHGPATAAAPLFLSDKLLMRDEVRRLDRVSGLRYTYQE
jgi:hypothetical protein